MSHGNTARMATEYGDDVLGKVCGAIASDESRHEIAYTRIVDEFFRWGAGAREGEGVRVWAWGWVWVWGRVWMPACPGARVRPFAAASACLADVSVLPACLAAAGLTPTTRCCPSPT